MAARKIVSQTQDATVSFKLLNLDHAPILTQDITFLDRDGIERSAKAGVADPIFVPEIDVIELCVIDNRVYHSVHGNYTTAMLKSTEENDYVIEKKLDGNFTFTVLQHNGTIKTKYEADPTYLDWLGLPTYDPAVHKTNLKHVGVGDPTKEDFMTEQAAAFEQKTIEEDNAKQTALEAVRKEAEDAAAANPKVQAAKEAATQAEHKTETEGE
jgi:hypothetical protein